MTTFLLGIAAGQLTFGPRSDRLGRKPPLLVGTTLCVLASLTAALAPSVGILLVARFAQGLGGAAGIVVSRAIVADIFHGSEAARTYSMLAAMGGLAPIVAPLLGGSLATPVGWRGVMGILLALTVGMLVVALFVIPETSVHWIRRCAWRARTPPRVYGDRCRRRWRFCGDPASRATH